MLRKVSSNDPDQIPGGQSEIPRGGIEIVERDRVHVGEQSSGFAFPPRERSKGWICTNMDIRLTQNTW
jgi:hypothetical protein